MSKAASSLRMEHGVKSHAAENRNSHRGMEHGLTLRLANALVEVTPPAHSEAPGQDL